MSEEQKHNTIVCGHCGKEYDEAFSYCPYCAEPKPQEPELTPEETIRHYDAREQASSYSSLRHSDSSVDSACGRRLDCRKYIHTDERKGYVREGGRYLAEP